MKNKPIPAGPKIWWSEEDKAYIVAGEYPGLSAFGKTKDEALKEYGIAKKAYLEVEAEDELIAEIFKDAHPRSELEAKSINAFISMKAKPGIPNNPI